MPGTFKDGVKCCESRYLGVPENTGEFQRVPEMNNNSEMCSPFLPPRAP